MPDDHLAWAGFADTRGLELLAVDHEAGIDTLVRFVLRGSAVDIDRALTSAEFSSAAVPGIEVFLPALDGFDLEKLRNPRSGEDQWTNQAGRAITRMFVRGALSTPDGREIIHVWAFTT